MTERFPDGSDPWQDGDVLTASDLNDTIDALGDGIDTIGEEAQENRLLLNKIQFQTSADPEGNKENMLVDIADGPTGYRGFLNTSNITSFKTGTLDAFHHPEKKIDNTSNETSNTVSNNITSDRTTYHPIQDQIFQITGLNSSSVDYNVVNPDGTVAKSGTINVNASNDPNLIGGPESVLDNAVAFVLQDNSQTPQPADLVVFDFVNEGKNETSDGGTSGNPVFVVSGVRNSNNNSYAGVGYDDDTYNFATYELSDSGITRLSEKVSPADDDLTTLFAVNVDNKSSEIVNFGNETDLIRATRLTNTGITNSNNTQNAEGSIKQGLDNGEFFFWDDSGYGKKYDIYNEGISNTSGTSLDKSFSTSQQHLFFKNNLTILSTGFEDGYVQLSNEIFFNSNLKNSQNTSLPGTGNISEFIIDDDNDRFHVVEKTGSDITYHTVDINSDAIQNASITWETDAISHTDNIEYVNTRFNSINANQTQYLVYDQDNSQEHGPFNTDEKIYIGDKNTKNIKIRLDDGTFNQNSGISDVSSIVW